MQIIVPVVIAVIHKDKTFFLTKRHGKDPDDDTFGEVWHFPGGALEFGEEIEEALLREIKEETNLTIQVEQQFPKMYSAIRQTWHGLLVPHLCTVVGSSDTIILDSESLEYGWFTYGEIKDLKKLPYVQDMADEAMKLLST